MCNAHLSADGLQPPEPILELPRVEFRGALKTILVWGAGPHGSSRVPTGSHGRFFQAVFRLQNYRFFAFFNAFLRGGSIETAGLFHIL